MHLVFDYFCSINSIKGKYSHPFLKIPSISTKSPVLRTIPLESIHVKKFSRLFFERKSFISCKKSAIQYCSFQVLNCSVHFKNEDIPVEQNGFISIPSNMAIDPENKLKLHWNQWYTVELVVYPLIGLKFHLRNKALGMSCILAFKLKSLRIADWYLSKMHKSVYEHTVRCIFRAFTYEVNVCALAIQQYWCFNGF